MTAHDEVLDLQLFKAEDEFDPCVSCASCGNSYHSSSSTSDE
ncbi:MAG TPA: hypothetical protein VJO35_12190 [Terriglobales bacterium]|nr:hypothetical protein [Terriglobales bacterium]